MALRAITAMLQGKIIDVTETISIQAAKFSADNKVGMADSLIYQTARMHKATLWTQDIDLAPFENVNYRAK